MKSVYFVGLSLDNDQLDAQIFLNTFITVLRRIFQKSTFLPYSQ